MSVRLTTDTLTAEELARRAVNDAGLLGMYRKDEFEGLMRVPLNDWSFDWLPSTLDSNTGRVKMKPMTQTAVKLIDRGRAIKIARRWPDIDLNRCVALIKTLKRHRLGMREDVQDALLLCWNRLGVDEALTDAGVFDRWVRKNNPTGALRPEHRKAVFELMSKTVRVMSKPRNVGQRGGSKSTA